MLQLLGVALLLCGLVTGFDSHGSSRLQPEVVAHLLTEVEANWVNDAKKVLENQGDSGEYEEMRKSCAKVSSSVVSASDGEKDRVTEYMTDVCGEMKDSALCAQFSNRLTSFMSPDASMNRDGSVDLRRFCKVLYRDVMSFAKEKMKAEEAERAKEAKLAAERAEEERKRQEEERKKQIEAMEVQKNREQQAAREAEEERQLNEQKEQQKKAVKEAMAPAEDTAEIPVPRPRILPHIDSLQPDRFMDRLQAKTQAKVNAQIKTEQKLQEAYFAKQKAKAQEQYQPQQLRAPQGVSLSRSVESMGL